MVYLVRTLKRLACLPTDDRVLTLPALSLLSLDELSQNKLLPQILAFSNNHEARGKSELFRSSRNIIQIANSFKFRILLEPPDFREIHCWRDLRGFQDVLSPYNNFLSINYPFRSAVKTGALLLGCGGEDSSLPWKY